MFDARRFTHDEMVEWALRSRARLSKSQVARAFLGSLTSRRLNLRAALGSFAVSLNMPLQRWSRKESSHFSCPICGAYESAVPEDLNVLNFERFKWGGVRHINPLYIGFDLEQFSIEGAAQPVDRDRTILWKILETARSLPAHSKLSDLVKSLAAVFPSNPSERRALIGVLGFCGILSDPSKPGFLNGFPPFSKRPEVPWVKNDWPYPVQWWNASYGVSDDAVAFWFADL